jgi:hypothetical protein
MQVMEQVFEREAVGTGGVFLLDATGNVLWSEGANPRCSARSPPRPGARFHHQAAQPHRRVRGRDRHASGRCSAASPLEETGWAVVVRPARGDAFAARATCSSTP